MVPVAARPPHESLQVAVERLEATGRGATLGEGDDLVVALVQGVMEAALI